MAAGKCLFGFCGSSTIRTRLVNDIFPIDSNGVDGSLTPVFKNLTKLTDYAAENLQHLPEICDILESLLKSYQDSGYLGFVNISLLAIRELLNRCLELESDRIIEPTVVNVLFQLFRSTNIQLVDKGFNFFLEYSEICCKSDFSIFVKPITVLCELTSVAAPVQPKHIQSSLHDDIPQVYIVSSSFSFSLS